MSNCDVCIGGWDEDAPEIYLAQVVTARKEHQCYECHKTIKSGERYETVSGRWDGEFNRFTFCLFCSEVSTVFSCGKGRMFGILWEEMRDLAFPNLTTNSPCFRELSVPSRIALIAKWQEWKGLIP